MSTLQASVPPPAPPDPPVNGAVALRWMTYVAWKLASFVLLGPIYIFVIAEGLRLLVPALAVKLYKQPIPGFAALGQFQETRRLDSAIFFAIVLLVAVWYLWEQVLKVILSTEAVYEKSGWKPETYKSLILILGSIVLVADAALFYVAMVQMGWGASRLSAPALLATAAYIAVIICVSLVSINLRKSINNR